VQGQAACAPCEAERLQDGRDFVRWWMHNGFVNGAAASQRAPKCSSAAQFPAEGVRWRVAVLPAVQQQHQRLPCVRVRQPCMPANQSACWLQGCQVIGVGADENDCVTTIGEAYFRPATTLPDAKPARRLLTAVPCSRRSPFDVPLRARLGLT